MSNQKPVTEYKNSELFEIINHIDREKYPERVLELEKEVEERKSRGDIPKDLVPEIDWSDINFERSAIIFFGILVLGTTLLSIFQLIELLGQEAKDSLLITSGINTALLFLGSIFLLANKPRLGIFALPSYIFQTLVVSFSGFQSSLILGVSFGFSLGSNGFSFGFTLGTSEILLAFESLGYFEIGINIYALIFSTLLVSLYLRKKTSN